jgi:hypothetical protein
VPAKQSPSFADILDLAIENHQSRIWTALPAQIVEYNPTTQRISAQPLVPVAHYNEDDERVVERLPVVGDVPVMFQRSKWGGTTFPLEAGDIGLLVFTSCPMSKWLSDNGREVRTTEHVEDRRNHLTDAVFVPGLFASSTPSSAPTDALVVHGALIKLGGDDASDPIMRRSERPVRRTHARCLR